MAPRKKAGPKIGLHIEVQVTDKAWHQFAIAIDRDVDIALQTKLPRGDTLRAGLEKVIGFALGAEAGLSAREIKADFRLFMEVVGTAVGSLHPQARALLDDPTIGWPNFEVDFEDLSGRVLFEIEQTEQEASDPRFADRFDEYFLRNVIWLVDRCAGIRPSFPSKGHYARANEFPVYRTARAAVEIACDLAERHTPGAAPKWKRLRSCTQSTFVSKLLRARHRFPWIRLKYSDIKPKTD